MALKLVARGRIWLGAIVSLVCLWLAIRPVPFAELEHSLRGASYQWLLLAIGFQLVSVLARAQRWVVLLCSEIRLSDAFWSQGIGYLFTNVFPLRLGEPARVVVMAERSELPITRVAASAVIERVLDVATILLLVLMILPFMQVPPLVTGAAVTFGAFTLLTCCALVVFVRSASVFDQVLTRAAGHYRFIPSQKIRPILKQLVQALEPMGEPRVALKAIGWSMATWSMSLVTYWCVLRAFTQVGLLYEAAFLLVSLSLASSIPSSPGFIGVFQLVGQQALVAPFGMKYSLAEAFGITLAAHLTYYLLTTLLGLIGLVIVGTSLTRLRRIVTTAPALPGVAPDVIA